MGNITAKGVASVFIQLVGWLVAIGGGAYGVQTGKDTALLALIVATGFMTVLLAQIDKFELLKGAGIEVKVRQVEQARKEVEQARERVEEVAEAAKRALTEAETAQAQVREAAQHMAHAVLGFLPGMGLFGGASPFGLKIATRDSLKSMLERLGTPRVAVDAATEPFDKKVRLILAARCTNAVAGAAQSEEGKELQKQLDFDKGVAPSSETLRAFIDEHAVRGDAVQKSIRALEVFEQTGAVPNDYDE